MGVYTRKDSPYFWMLLERPHAAPQRRSTHVPARNLTPDQARLNRTLAQQVYAKTLTDLAAEEHGLAPKKRAAIRFDAYADWYERHVSAKKAGHERETAILKNLRAGFGGARELVEATRPVVQEWMTARLKDVTAATVNRELDVLKHLLASAVPKHLAASPIVGLRRLRMRKTEARTLSRADETKLLKQLAVPDRALVILAIDTLMRLSDLLELRWAQVHGRYATVLNPKTGDSYKVPLSSRARAALDTVTRKGLHVFWHRRLAKNARDWRGSVESMFARACKAAGVDYGLGRGVTFHGLRHTGASRMVEAGVDLRTVQEIGGWKNLRQLTRYTHPTDRAKQRAVEQIGGRKSRPRAHGGRIHENAKESAA